MRHNFLCILLTSACLDEQLSNTTGGGDLGDELEDSDGYSITKTDDDFYTFTVSTSPSITGNGGGGMASSGPTTLSN